MKKKYKLSYTCYAKNKTEALKELSSAIFHSGVYEIFNVEEIPLELWEVKHLDIMDKNEVTNESTN